MKTSDLFQVLDELSQEHVPHDVNLLPGVMANINRGKNKTMKPRIKLASAILLAATAFVLLIFTIPGAATAMRRMFSFIPGIGLVEKNANLRVLEEPVTQTRDGFTLTVENGVLDSKETVISYIVEGPFAAGAFQSEHTLSEICFAAAELRLPDGTVYQAPGGFPDETWDTGYRVKYSYDALPVEIDQATLVLPCIHALPIGQGPQNWEMPLVFKPAPDDMAMYPIGGQEDQEDEESAGDKLDMTLGIDMYLDSVIPLTDGQLVQVRVDWQDNPAIAQVKLNPEDVNILNSEGQEISFVPSSEAVNPDENDPTSIAYGYKTALMGTKAPAKLIVKAAAEVAISSTTSFTFDPAASDAVDQVWTLNKDLDLNGQKVQITKVSLYETGGNASLTIDMQSNTDVISVGLTDLEHPVISGADGKSGDISDGVNTWHQFWVTLNYDGGLPEGPITFIIPSYTIRMEGEPWIIEWDPSTAPAGEPATAEPTQVEDLSKTDWQKALENTHPIPDELNKQMLLELKIDEGRLHDQMAVSRLDGSEMRFLVEDAANGVASPDGSRMVYTDDKGGIQVYTFETGTIESLVDTNSLTGIDRLFWSPDGTQIGFSVTDNNGPLNVYIADLDGSSPSKISAGEPLKLMQGWLPDGRILYVTQDQNGPVLKMIDPQSGTMSSLFNVPQLATFITASKDGRRLAINWMAESTGEQFLYVYTADGSQRRSILKMNADGNLREMTWSADGRWLLVDLSWNVADEPYAKAMIQVDTGQILPLPELEGTVTDWLP